MISEDRVRELLSKHGAVRPQPASDWTGAFPLPSSIERFYGYVGPADITIQSGANPFFIPSLAGLWPFQAGYRWNGLTGTPLAGWNDDWLVVADEAGDPFIFSRSSGHILSARHGTGEWEPVEVFSDIDTMAASLAVLGAVVVAAGNALVDEEYRIRPEHRSQAESRLVELLGSREATARVLGSLGWG